MKKLLFILLFGSYALAMEQLSDHEYSENNSEYDSDEQSSSSSSSEEFIEYDEIPSLQQLCIMQLAQQLTDPKKSTPEEKTSLQEICALLPQQLNGAIAQEIMKQNSALLQPLIMRKPIITTNKHKKQKLFKAIRTAFNHNSSLVAAAYYKDKIGFEILDITSPTAPQTIALVQTKDWIKELQFVKNNILWVGLENGTILVYDTTQKFIIHEYYIIEPGLPNTRLSLNNLCISPNGTLVATAHENEETITIWRNEKELYSVGEDDDCFTITFNHDGTILAGVTDQGYAKLWDMQTGKLVDAYKHYHPKARGHYIAFNHNSTLLAATFVDGGKTLIWHLPTHQLAHKLPIQKKICFSPDGTHIATHNGWDTITLWDTYSGALLHTLDTDGHGIGVSLSFNHNGTQLLAPCDADGICLWYVPNISGDNVASNFSITIDETLKKLQQLQGLNPTVTQREVIKNYHDTTKILQQWHQEMEIRKEVHQRKQRLHKHHLLLKNVLAQFMDTLATRQAPIIN